MMGAHLPEVDADCSPRLPPLRVEEAEGESGGGSGVEEEGEEIEGGGTEVVVRAGRGESDGTTPAGAMGAGGMMGGMTGGDR